MNVKPSRVPLLSLVGLAGFAAVGLAVDATVPTASAAPPPHAAAKSVPPGLAKNRFLGAHPLVGSPATGYCYIDVPHVHDYVPDRPAVFKEVGDEYVFTGDPVPFGYEGDKTVFYGHHPVPVPVEVTAAAGAPPTFCFIKGPHYHDYPQPEVPGFKQKDSAVFYVGPIPPEVAQERPQAERAVEVEYQPYVALRPQVKVTPPPEWQGAVWVPPPSQPVVVASPQPQVVVAPPQPVVVAPPQVVVAPPQPQVVVAPPQPQIVVAPPQPRVVVAPPSVVVAPPHPSVVVVPPHPPSIVIGAPAPPGVIFYGGPGYGYGHGHGYGHGGWRGGGHGGWKGGGHGGWKGGRH